MKNGTVFFVGLFKIIYLFIYLYNFANEQTAHYIHKYRKLAGYTLQLAPITAALYINTIQQTNKQTIELITTRDFTGQITTLVTRQTYRFPCSWIIYIENVFTS